jgi:hypothetical protein
MNNNNSYSQRSSQSLPRNSTASQYKRGAGRQQTTRSNSYSNSYNNRNSQSQDRYRSPSANRNGNRNYGTQRSRSTQKSYSSTEYTPRTSQRRSYSLPRLYVEYNDNQYTACYNCSSLHLAGDTCNLRTKNRQ